jgi:hypothetical protein
MSKSGLIIAGLVVVTVGAYLYAKNKKTKNGIVETKVYTPSATDAVNEVIRASDVKQFDIFQKTSPTATDRFLINPSGGVLDRSKQQSVFESEANKRAKDSDTANIFSTSKTVNEIQKTNAPTSSSSSKSTTKTTTSQPKASSSNTVDKVVKSAQSVFENFTGVKVSQPQSIAPSVQNKVSSSPVVKALSGISKTMFGI